MKRALIAALAATVAGLASVPARAADVGVSIGISQPGVYGRIDIGRFPQPAVVVGRPVWGAPVHARPAHAPAPVYMWVPPGHRKHWRAHCARYGACGAPVYFVQDRWYHSHVAPPRGHRGDDPRPPRGHRHDDRRGPPGHWQDDPRPPHPRGR